MTTRRESVVLDLQDNFTAGMIKAAGATALLDKELNSLDGSTVRSTSSTDRGTSAFTRNAGAADRSAASVSKSSKSLDDLDQKARSAERSSSLLLDSVLTLGPALVPLGAAAVPAIAGLTLQLGLAAGAAGVAVLAFHGIGTALTALDAYQVAPTAAHFAALQTAMDKLGPAGGEFVLALDKMKPKLQEFQNVAEAGLLPGVTDGLQSVIDQMPQLQDVIFTIASTMGDLARESGKALGGPEMTKFFDYLNVTARPVLTEMGQTLGNFVGGLANMLMAFDPLSRSFSTGFLNMSKAFNQWAAGLSQSQGFQDFVDYVQKAGPAAADALGSILNALVQLVEAAAPVGSAVLPVISALADGLAAIADSPVGPLLIGTAAAIGVLGRSMALLKAAGLTGAGESMIGKALGVGAIRGALPAMREASAATKALAVAQKEAGLAHAGYLGGLRASSVGLQVLGKQSSAAQKSMTESAGGLVAANKSLATASERAATAEKAKGAAFRGSAAGFGKAAALAGGLTLATSGLADASGLSNTASLALMGTIAGPWGAAIGGGVGLVKDLASANNDLETAMKNVDAIASAPRLDLPGQQAALDGLRKASADYNAQLDQAGKWNNLNLKDSITSVTDMWTHSGAEGEAATAKQQAGLTKTETAFKSLATEMGTPLPPNATPDQIQAFADSVAPAMQRAGISVKDFVGYGRVGVLQVAGAVGNYNAVADSASTKSAAVAKAMADLGNQMAPVATQADALKNAMDSLFGPAMNQSAATDAWAASLQALGKQIKSTNGDMLGQNDAARANRAVVMGSIQALKAQVEADAAVDGSGKRAAETLIKGRNAIIAQARAAGASEPAIKKYLNTLQLTPKNLTTFITENGSLSAREKVKALTRLYNLTPKQLRTLVTQAGMAKSQADIDALAKKYHLTPEQVHTLLSATDAASSKAQTVKDALARLHDKNVGITANVAGLGAVSALAAGIGALHSKTVSINTVHTNSQIGAINAGRASGGPVVGVGGPTQDNIPIMASVGEYVVNANAMKTYGRTIEWINAQGLAAGGPVQGFAAGGQVNRADVTFAQQIAAATKQQAQSAKEIRAQHLADLQAQQQIRDIQRELSAMAGKKGHRHLALQGLDRRQKQAELLGARDSLADTRNAPKQAAAERAKAIRDALAGFSLSGVLPQADNPNVITVAMKAQIADLRKSLTDAGGSWTKGLSKWSASLTTGARTLDHENQARDRLKAKIDDETAALDTLKQTMASYADSVASKFLTDPFNAAHTVSTPGVVDPRLAANLTAAQAQLAALRNSPTGDSVGNAAAASKLIPQIAAMTAEVDRQSQPVDTMVSGLQSLHDQLTESSKDADIMTASLKALSSKGLDTTGKFGGLYASLAGSGDFATAAQLAALSSQQINEYEKLFATTNDKAAAVGALATQAVYGAQQAQMVAQIAGQNKVLIRLDGGISQLEARLTRLGGDVEHGAARGTAGMREDIQALTKAVQAQAGQLKTLERAGIGKGRS